MESILKHDLDRQPLPGETPPRAHPRTTTCGARLLPLRKRTAHAHQPHHRGTPGPPTPGHGPGLQEQREHPDYEGLRFEERLGLLVDQELTERQNRRLQRTLKAAKLRCPR